MADESETAIDSSRKRRRSRASKTAKSTQSPATRVRRAWRRWLIPGMMVITVLWGALTYLRTYEGAQMYDFYASGMTKGDALYAVGKPNRTYEHHGRERWIYRTGTKVMAIDFGSDGEVANVLCTSKNLSPMDCPRAHGVALGMSEDQIWYRLGAPSVERYEGTQKVIAYPAVNLTFRLEQFRVSAIAVQPDQAILGSVPLTLRKLVP